MTDLYDYDDGYDYCEDDSCSICGGESHTECNDPIQCCRRHFGNSWDQFCECVACGGSGMAKDQVIW